MSNRSFIIGGLAAATLVIAGSSLVRADSVVGVCAFTGSTPPYQFTQVNSADLSTYEDSHPHDIYNVSGPSDCPATIRPVKDGGDPTPSASPNPTPSPSPSPTGTVLSTSTALPAELPATGSGLMSLIGLPTVAAASGAYIRARLNRR